LVAPFGPHFPRLSSISSGSASILRLRNYDMSLTTLLSLADVAVVQPLARSASYPCLFAGSRQCPLAATYPAPGSYILLACFDVFPRVRFSDPRVDLAPVCVGQSAIFSPRSRRAYSGLYATPEFFAIQSVRVAYRSNPRIPTYTAFSRAVTCVSASLWFTRLACAYRPVSALTSDEFRVGPFSVRWLLPHRLVLRS